MAAYTSPPIEVVSPAAEHPFYRADIVLYGLDHSGPSFEARVFVNNTAADATTPLALESGYAGSIWILGHGGCFGDEGHCEVPREPVSPFDRRAGHSLTPANKQVIATEAIRRALAGGPDATVTVTVVAVVKASPLARPDDAADVLAFDELAILTYD